jgi:hypothetical protein
MMIRTRLSMEVGFGPTLRLVDAHFPHKWWEMVTMARCDASG